MPSSHFGHCSEPPRSRPSRLSRLVPPTQIAGRNSPSLSAPGWALMDIGCRGVIAEAERRATPLRWEWSSPAESGEHDRSRPATCVRFVQRCDLARRPATRRALVWSCADNVGLGHKQGSAGRGGARRHRLRPGGVKTSRIVSSYLGQGPGDRGRPSSRERRTGAASSRQPTTASSASSRRAGQASSRTRRCSTTRRTSRSAS
jgi:hypothetical protein